MSAGPHLSVAIPAYNLGRWTGGAVSSALALGSIDEVEVVVVDDGSTDDTLEVLAAFGDVPNLRVLTPAEHLGLVGNFNRVVSESRGRWVTVLGADDELLPGYFEHLRPHVSRTDTAAFTQVALMQWREGESVFGRTEPGVIGTDELVEMLGGAACISTTAFRRDLFHRVGGFAAAMGSLIDLDLLVRLSVLTDLPVRALGTEGGRYYPLRGSTWTRQHESGEGSERLLDSIRSRRVLLGPELEREARRALARRARMTGRAQLLAGKGRAARRSFSVAALCSTGAERVENNLARALTFLPPAFAAPVLDGLRYARSWRGSPPATARNARRPTSHSTP